VTGKGSGEEEEDGEGYTSQKPLGFCAQEFCQKMSESNPILHVKMMLDSGNELSRQGIR
jgi:hypothetical protein